MIPAGQEPGSQEATMKTIFADFNAMTEGRAGLPHHARLPKGYQ